MPLPFGIKAPSRGTLIFTGIVGSIGGSYFGGKYYAQQSRQALCDKVSWLADRPCGVHERPRKVQVFITAPPGDGLEKSRNWFGDYVKPVLVAAAIDYEVKESRESGQITSVVREQVIERRKKEQLERQQATASETPETSTEATTGLNAFAPVMNDILKQQLAAEHDFDGVIAIGRNAWREVVNGLNQGCTISLQQVAKEEAERKAKLEQDQNQQSETTIDTNDSNELTDEQTTEEQPISSSSMDQDVEIELTESSFITNYSDESMTLESNNNNDDDSFGVPSSLSPIMYIPHENIIGWTNIPYRLFMWVMDYQRIERFGEDVVAVALNKTRPLQLEDLDVGYQEMKYWIGDDDAKTIRDNDQPIQMDDHVRIELKTYTH